ncbi:MAG: hypothetical protein LIR46_04755 [Bacteroidota bacterium]|nr:hypothetical protein [Bacteroidota bacterium]
MYGVSDAVIEAFKTDGVHKDFKIILDNVEYYNDKIVDESFNLKQSIMDSEDFEAVGCIASSLSLELRAQFPTKQKGKKIQVFIKADNTLTWIPIFTGYVNKCQKTANGWRRSIEAYDFFYTMSGQSGNNDGNTKKEYNITDWYNSHYVTTVHGILVDVCNKYGLPVSPGDRALVNGSIEVNPSARKASELSALDLIKECMKINGCFGYIKGDGAFSWRYLELPSHDTDGWLYPSAFAFPQGSLYPGQDTEHVAPDVNADNFIGEYENLQYEDFKMLPIDTVVVRDYEADTEQGSCGSGENKYIINGNMFTYGKNKTEKDKAAKNLYDILNSTYYVPFEAELPGLPYLQCGDPVSFYDFVDDYGQASLQRFYILSRSLSGSQHLKDVFSASGDEYKHEFSVDGKGQAANTDEIKDDLEQYVDDAVASASGCRIVSVTSLSDIPDPPAANTIYCIQSEIQIVETIWTPDDQNESTANQTT